MSSMKSGLSTLNRWLGKKNKDKSGANGNLSKSNTNLSISNTNLNETSQLEYNRITPLPAATSNAPFEQTFRITVLLPKEQLYVARLGARVPLSKLLQLVCDNKLLDASKYEFRNPVDSSQIYSCDLTIGAVGLSEIRLCHKSDPHSNGNYNNEILQRSAVIRDSLSSSEFSSRHSKHTTKTTSPYSSSNSINSMDSTGMNYTRTPVSPPPVLFPTTTPMSHKVEAPPRKKRAAPRPPSQIAIPEKSALVMEPQPTSITTNESNINAEPTANGNIMRKDYYVSTPNLNTATSTMSVDASSVDCNGIKSNKLQNELEEKNKRNSYGGSVQNLSSAEPNQKLPEPTPRKRLIQIKKKAAPVPPGARTSMYFDDEDSVSIASATATTVESKLENTHTVQIPKPVPRVTTMTLLNSSTTDSTANSTTNSNVSKVMLNRTPTPEPQSYGAEETASELDANSLETPPLLNGSTPTCEDDDNISKQADSGIGEPVPSPIPDSLPSEGSTHECKSTFESSSDDDEMIKVYNFKLCKTHIKPMETLEDLTQIATADSDSTDNTMRGNLTHENTPSCISETASWNFTVPISPPPNFADGKQQKQHEEFDSISDAPITPKLKERPVLNFENLNVEPLPAQEPKLRAVTPMSPTTPLNELVDELSSIMQEQRMDTLIKKASTEQQQIEAAKPNKLSNFSISTITQAPNKTDNVLTCKQEEKTATPPTTPEEEKLYRKRGSITNGNLFKRNSVSRADSFHSTALSQSPTDANGLSSRSASYLSLTKLEQAAGSAVRRSSSELSIGESPSLQSVEVIKTILNSRKNSLANGSNSDEEQKLILNDNNNRSVKSTTAIATASFATTSATMTELKSNNKTDTAEATEAVTNQVPKTYRYSGPPSINFSTWSERPKAQVAIKNEGDYIFGGIKNNTADVQRKESITESPIKSVQPSPIERMGIPQTSEQAFKVPITVKPLKDVIVDGTTLNGNSNPAATTTTTNATTATTISFLGKTKWNHNRDVKTELSVTPRTAPAQTTHASSTLPRSNVNRYSLAATAVTVSAAPTLLRNTSITKVSKEDTNSAVPFGQNTLRKTGFKEKILAKEQAAEQTTAVKSNSKINTESTVSINSNAAAATHVKSKPLQSTKLELKLQSTAVYLNSTASATPSTAPILQPAATPKTAPILQPPPPPAPPAAMPFLRSVSAKPKSANTTPTDPRDQLLEAIRGFNRQQLNRT